MYDIDIKVETVPVGPVVEVAFPSVPITVTEVDPPVGVYVGTPVPDEEVRVDAFVVGYGAELSCGRLE